MRPLAAAGNVNVDLIMGPVAPWPAHGTEIFVTHDEVRPGGCAGNVALAWRALGAEFQIAGSVGDDAFGQYLTGQFGPIAARWPVASSATTLSVGMTHPDGERTFSDAEVDEMASKRDLLPNLELLPGPVNIGKSDTSPDTWAATEHPDEDERRAFYKLNALPADLPHSPSDFPAFFDARRAGLIARIKDKLKTQGSGPVPEASPVTGEDIDESLAEGDVGD